MLKSDKRKVSKCKRFATGVKKVDLFSYTFNFKIEDDQESK